MRIKVERFLYFSTTSVIPLLYEDHRYISLERIPGLEVRL